MLTPRQAAALLGGLMALAGLIALSLPISADYDSDFLGDMTADCGSALSSNIDTLGGDPEDACEDAVGTRRMWAWPLGIVGVVVFFGVALVTSPRSPQQTQETGPSESDSEGPVAR
jgi:hypothetical protein